VITIETYLAYFPAVVAAGAIAIFGLFCLLRNKLNLTRINSWLFFSAGRGGIMTLIQSAFMAGAVLLGLIMLLNIRTSSMALSPLPLIILFYILVLCVIITAILYAVKEKNKPKRFLLAVLGIRNFLFGVSVFTALSGITYGSGIVYDGNTNLTSSYFFYRFNTLGFALIVLIATLVIYLVIKYRTVKKYF